MIQIEFSNVRDAPSVDEQELVQIHHWRVCLVAGERHLLGWISEGATTRMSSPIIELRLSARQVVTSSGRVYELDGHPTEDPDRLLFLAARLIAIGQGPVDVSDQIWSEMINGGH